MESDISATPTVEGDRGDPIPDQGYMRKKEKKKMAAQTKLKNVGAQCKPNFTTMANRGVKYLTEVSMRFEDLLSLHSKTKKDQLIKKSRIYFTDAL